MPKASSKRGGRNTASRQDPIAKPKSKNSKSYSDEKPAKDPKASHLYTDDNPSTTLHGTGFKDAATAKHTLSLVSQRSLTYQFQTINTMYHRAKNHPHSKGNKDIEDAMSVFREWLDKTYPRAKEERNDFKPLLKRDTIRKHISELQGNDNIDSRFAQVYVDLPKGKRLANVLVDENHPEGRDWDIERQMKLQELTDGNNAKELQEMARDGDGLSLWGLRCVAWAWSPLKEREL